MGPCGAKVGRVGHDFFPPSVYLSPMPIFDLYWRLLGLPLSRAKGVLTDAIPFSIVEVALWVGTTATILFLLSWIPRLRPGLVRYRRLTLCAGPVFLVALGLGQGAFPLSIAPTGLRESLPERLGQGALEESTFKKWVKVHEASLQKALRNPADWQAFQALSEEEVLRICDTSLDAELAFFGLPPGRTVRTAKAMGPWTTAIGLLYGGPAFHDPFFGEIAIVRDKDMPAPHYWRLIAACHEAAHAKGFTREIDAEILTYFSLSRQRDPRLQALADIHFLRKTGIRVDWPESLLTDVKRANTARLRAEASRPILRRLKSWLQETPLQNSSAKYGVRRKDESWDSLHPFFSTIFNAHTNHGEWSGGAYEP
jgi:hypothetical protein